MKLTKAQYFALVDLAGVERATPYELGIPVSVFRNLWKKGLAASIAGSGAHSVWFITLAGRAALSQEGE